MRLLVININNVLSRYFRISSLVVILLSLAVIYGWFSKNILLIQILPYFVPMQFNTAFLFLISSISLFIIKDYPQVSKKFSIIIILISFLTLIQYIFHLNIGIDEMFMNHYITVETSHPGRMDPNTAICFILYGISLYLYLYTETMDLTHEQSARNRLYSIASFTFILLTNALSFVAFLGYVLKIYHSYNWLNLTSMAIHTSVCFIILSSGFIHYFIYDRLTNNEETIKYIPYAVLVPCIFVTSLFSLSLYINNTKIVTDKVKSVSKLFENDFKDTLIEEMLAIKRLYNRIELKAYSNDSQLTNDVSSYMKDMSSLIVFTKTTDKSNIYLQTKIKEKYKLDILIKECNFFASKFNSKLNDAQLKTVFIKDNLCIFSENQEHLSILDYHNLLNNFKNNSKIKEHYDGYLIEALHKGNKIFTFSNTDSFNYMVINKVTTNLDLFGEIIEISITPHKDTVSYLSSTLHYTVFILGIALSILVSVLIMLWVKYFIKYKKSSIDKKILSDLKQLSDRVIEHSSSAIIITDNSLNILFCNHVTEDLLGNEKNIIYSKNIIEYIHPDDSEYFINTVKNIQKFGGYFNESFKEVKLVHEGNKPIYISFSIISLKDKDEKKLLFFIDDLTNFKEKENKIIRKSSYIKLIFDATNIASELKDINESLQACLDLICTSLEWPVGHIYEIYEDKSCLKSTNIWYCYDEKKSKKFKEVTNATNFCKGVGLPGRIWSTRSSVWIEDVYQDNNFPRAKVCKDLNVHGAVGFPIIIQNNVAMVFEFFSFENKKYDDELIKIFTVLGEQISRIFERKLSQNEIAKMKEYNDLLLESMGDGLYGVDIHGNTTFVNPAALKMLGYKKGELIGKPEHSLIHHTKLNNSIHEVSDCLIHKSFYDRKTYHTDDDIFWRKDGSNFPVEYTSKPIISTNGEIQGAIINFKDISQRKEYEEKLKNFAYYDSLTGAINRMKFSEIINKTLSKSKRYNRLFALIMLDIDDFKIINDKYGHQAGDLILVEIVKRVKNSIRTEDSICRFGGDEFLILLEEIMQVSDLKLISNKIIEATNPPIAINGDSISVSISLGFSVYSESDNSFESLLNTADSNLYKAKKIKKSGN